MLPFVRQVICVDFGSGGRMDWPDSVYARLVDLDKKNDPLAKTAWYVNKNGHHLAKWRWDSDKEGYDRSIHTSEALDVYRRMGSGLAITSSTKEQRFLVQQGVHLLGVVDEDRLHKHLEDLHAEAGSRYEMPKLPGVTATFPTQANSFYRSWRLARLVEDYKTLFFESSSRERALQTFEGLGNLKFPEM